jgi:ATP-dependent Zn protease
MINKKLAIIFVSWIFIISAASSVYDESEQKINSISTQSLSDSISSDDSSEVTYTNTNPNGGIYVKQTPEITVVETESPVIIPESIIVVTPTVILTETPTQTQTQTQNYNTIYAIFGIVVLLGIMYMIVRKY